MSFGLTPKEGRRPLDWYPTPRPLSIALCERVALPRRIAEPCAGDLSLARVLREYRLDVLTGDIDPEWTTDVGAVDFLGARAIPAYRSRAVVTNPPFAIAPEVVEQSLRIADWSCHLLPLNWLEPCLNRHDVAQMPGHCLIFQRCEHTDFSGGGGDSKTVMWRIFDRLARGLTVSFCSAAELREIAARDAGQQSIFDLGEL